MKLQELVEGLSKIEVGDKLTYIPGGVSVEVINVDTNEEGQILYTVKDLDTGEEIEFPEDELDDYKTELKEGRMPEDMKEIGKESELLKKANKHNQLILKTATKILKNYVRKDTDFGVQGSGSRSTGPTYYTTIRLKKNTELKRRGSEFREFQNTLKAKLGKDFNRISFLDDSSNKIVVIYYSRPKG